MASQSRKVQRVIEPAATSDGAGVRLKRSIATRTLDYLDPFLLFDHFGSDDPDDYIAGFPMHPHRGIETVTYMLAGEVRHRDSIGHAGTIAAGDVQWMTAGRGILHEEMPQLRGGRLDGFQLWVNLPAKLKMSRPRYQEVAARDIPVVTHAGGVQVRVIAGRVGTVSGAVREIAADPEYLDVAMPAQTAFTQPVAQGHTAFAYLYEGEAKFGVGDGEPGTVIQGPRLVVFADGDEVRVASGGQGAHFLLISGKPLNEPVVRYGPFVMNTRQEIEQTLRELQDGSFIR